MLKTWSPLSLPEEDTVQILGIVGIRLFFDSNYTQNVFKLCFVVK
jgi:hypothetical protein